VELCIQQELPKQERNEKMSVTFSRAIVEYFGKKPGQTLSEFTAELKALTPEDRAYFVKEFAKVGIEVEVPK
jgi:hypothetical protein